MTNQPLRYISSNSSNESQYYAADKDGIPSNATDSFILAMFPLAKGSYLFNGDDKQEWQIEENQNTEFVVYGMLHYYRFFEHKRLFFKLC